MQPAGSLAMPCQMLPGPGMYARSNRAGTALQSGRARSKGGMRAQCA